MRPPFLRKPVLVVFLALLSSFALAQSQPAATPAPKTVLVKAARLLDVASGQYQNGVAILVEGDRIKAIGPAAQLQAQAPNAEVIDLGNATLLPGLIDCHTHLGSRADRYDEL